MTKSRLIILTGFLAGSAMGYFDFFHISMRSTAGQPIPASSRNDSHSSQPRLVPGKSLGILPLPDETNINGLLLKYADFSPQETKEEFLRLLKASRDNKDYNSELNTALGCLAYNLGFQSPEEVQKLLQTDKPLHNDYHYIALLEGWAQKDFQGAMAYLLEHKRQYNHSSRAFRTLTLGITQKDPDLALKWLPALTSGERTAALEIMGEIMPKNHPEKMTGFITILPPHNINSSSIYSAIAATWAKTDWPAAKAWIDTLKKEQKNKLLPLAFFGLSKTDLEKATEELKKIDRKDNESIVNAIVDGINDFSDSKTKTLDWLLENKNLFDDSERIIVSCLNSDAAQSPEIIEKVLNLPDEKLKDSILESMVNKKSNMAVSGYDHTGVHYDPGFKDTAFQEVMNLADQIGDVQKRKMAVSDTLNDWIRSAPESAGQWVRDSSRLSDKEKQYFLQIFEEHKKSREADKS